MSELIALSKVLASSGKGSLTFFCKGCDGPHSINHGLGAGPRWGWNGSLDKPTFTPSVLVSWNEGSAAKVCHSFVTDGRIQYLGDCTHALAGQTVDLADWKSNWDAW